MNEKDIKNNSDCYTIEAIARETANDLGFYSSHYYFQFEQWAIRGYREAYFDFAGKAVPVILKMDNLRIVNLPSWAIDWIKVGAMRGERAIFFGKAGDLAMYNYKDDCGVPIPNAPRPPIEQYPVGINIGAYLNTGFGQGVNSLCTDSRWAYKNSANYNGLFGEEGKYPDIRLRFSSEISQDADIYAELMTDGLDVCGKTFVHPYLYEYVVAYCHWKRVKGNDGASPTLKEEKRIDKDRERKWALMRMRSIDPEELENILAQAFRLTTKR